VGGAMSRVTPAGPRLRPIVWQQRAVAETAIYVRGTPRPWKTRMSMGSTSGRRACASAWKRRARRADRSAHVANPTRPGHLGR